MENHVHFEEAYFKKTIREYQDWILALIRELIQNSVDAKSLNIKFYIHEEDGYIYLSCEDDGHGMNKTILKEKFLVMGGSYKENSESAGGFGYAKSLILFCHEHYEIHTQDNYVSGSYGVYSNIENVDNYVGTKITTHVDKELVSETTLKSKLIHWVLDAHLPKVKISLNDEVLEQSHNKFKYKKDINIGKLSFNEGEKNLYKSSICIRMRGMPMFQRDIWGNTDVYFRGYVDLNFKSSIDCLTSNRDGLLKKYDNDLNELVQDLTTERSKYKLNNLSEFLINKPVDYIKSEKTFEEENDDIENEKKEVKCFLSGKIIKKDLVRNRTTLLASDKIENDNIDVDNSLFKKLKNEKNDFSLKIKSSLQKLKTFEYPKSFLIKVEGSEDRTKREIMKNYTNIINLLNQKKSIKLAEVWTDLIHQTLELLVKAPSMHGFIKEGDQYFYHGSEIFTGYVMSDDRETLASMYHKDRSYYILLNIMEYKNMKLNKNDLIHLAFHEIAHVLESYHNERHGGYMFAIHKIMVDNKVKVK